MTRALILTEKQAKHPDQVAADEAFHGGGLPVK